MKTINDIRLTPEEIKAIQHAFAISFLPGDKLWIFGSRVYPEKKGGDIDLYIETQLTNIDDVYRKKMDFVLLVENRIGEQKIDVIVNYGSNSLRIYAIAKKEGVKLV